MVFVLLYSANQGVLALFMARGSPFTICGIMCVGNFLGCVSLYPVFFRQITWKNVRCVYRVGWFCVCFCHNHPPIYKRDFRLGLGFSTARIDDRKVTSAQWGWMLLGCLLANVLGSAAYLQGLKLTRLKTNKQTG